MNKIFSLFLALTFSIANVFAATPADLVIDDAGKIQIDAANPRDITGCWDSDENAVMFYFDKNNNIFASEICDSPDSESRGLGLTDAARALNYYDFLNKTFSEFTEENTDTILGSLSKYNYSWLKEFLKLDGACEKFDVLAFHPFHFGVAPDEVNSAKNADHTVEQWVNFYRQILKDANCEKPIWATGFGFATSDWEDQSAVSETEQIDFAIKELVMLLGGGVERIGYSKIPGFTLSDEAVEEWNALANKLANSKFESLDISGENYCPLETSCFFDENEYRADTDSSVFGLPTEPNKMKKNRTYSFLKDDNSRIFVFWKTGEVGVGITESPFSDITPESNHLAAILGLTEREIISGYANGTFGPDLQINRAEFLKILVGATKNPDLVIAGKNCFPDVGNEWFSPFVCYAKARNWVSGYDDGNFRPSDPINRAETLKILAKAFGWSTTETSEAWYKPFVNAAIAENILLTNEAKDYDKCENRGFIAELIWRTLGN